MERDRFYLTRDRLFYGVLSLLGEPTIMSTSKQNEANVFFEEELDFQIDELNKRGVRVKAIKVVDGNLRATSGRGLLHYVEGE